MDKEDPDFWLYPMPVDPLWEAIYDEDGRKLPGGFHTLPATDSDDIEWLIYELTLQFAII